MRRLVATLLLLIAVAVAAFLAMTQSPERQPLGYRTAKASRGDILRYVTATGRLDALVTVKVSSQLSGQIAEVLVGFNDRVTPGQPLARLDAKTYQARVREAEARVANARAAHAAAKAKTEGAAARHDEAKRDFARKSALRRRRIVAAKDVDSARSRMLTAASELKAARAQETVRATEIDMTAAALLQARIDLARTVIRAPIAGIVLKRDVDLGQTVAASLRAPILFTIAKDLRRMEVRAFVDEADIGIIRRGQQVLFRVDAFPGRFFRGLVKKIRKAPKVIQNVTTYTVVISADNPRRILLPGMTATVRIIVAARRNVLKVPNAALRFHPGLADGSFKKPGGSPRARRDGVVWTHDASGRIAKVPVKLGLRDDVATEVVSGGIGAGRAVIIGFAPARRERGFLGLRWGF